MSRRFVLRWPRTALFVVMALALSLLTPASTLAAQQQCVPNRAPHDITARYVWTHGTPANINGVSADILEMNPFYTGSNGTGTNASIMLVRWNPVKWAQLGWAKSKIQDGVTIKRQVFLEFYLAANQNFFRFWPGRTIQTQTWYEILNDGLNFDFFVAGNWVASYSGFTPSEYQLFGETHDIMDQMPGVAANVQTFRNATYFTGLNGAHNAAVMVSGVINPQNFYGGQRPADGVYYVWDKCIAAAAAAPAAVPAGENKMLSVSAPASDRIAQADVPMLGLRTATEVTDGASLRVAPGGVSREDALAIAQKELGDADMHVYQGTASEFVDSAVKSVWVVTVAGGSPPMDGPSGGPAIAPPGYTGVIIDAATGRVWSGFMH